MKKSFLTVLLCLLISIASAGCGPAEQFISGRIADKVYEEAYVQTITGVRPMVCGKVTVCIPYTQHISHPEAWNLVLVQEDGRERKIGVSEADWNSFEIGDSVKYDRWDGTVVHFEEGI